MSQASNVVGEVVRIVTFEARQGQEDQLGNFLASRVVEINRRFGALGVWCLSGEGGMGIVSVWARGEDLDAMRAAPDYGDVLAELKSLSQDLVDGRYEVIVGSSVPGPDR